MSRIKKPVTPIITRDEAEVLVNDIAVSMNLRRQYATLIDEAKLAIDQEYAVALAAIDESVSRHTASVQAWAEANPAEFQKRKSVEFASGTIGFRTGTPAVKTIRKTTWPAIVEALRGIKRLAVYIAVEETVAKDKILSDYSSGILIDQDLALAGLKVAQSETFYVEPNLTEQAVREVAPAKAA